MRRRFAFFLVTAAAITFASSARADAHSDAVAAFDRGKSLRDAGKFAEAAKEFKDSVDREKSVGGYYNLGLCLDKIGRYPEALKAYRQSVAIAQEKGDPRAKEALDAVQAVRNRTHWVIVNVRDDIAQTPGLKLELDGREVRSEDHGIEVFNASSEHTLKIAAKDYADLVVHPTDRQPFTVEKLGKSLVAPPETIPAGSAAAPEQQAWGFGKWTGVVLAAGGIAGLAVGVTFTNDFYSTRDGIQEKYKAAKCAPGSKDATCQDLETQFNTNRDEATVKQAVAYGAGGLLLVGGAFLFFLTPGELGRPFGLNVTPRTGAGYAGIDVSGRF
jgi:hypothetical protein